MRDAREARTPYALVVSPLALEQASATQFGLTAQLKNKDSLHANDNERTHVDAMLGDHAAEEALAAAAGQTFHDTGLSRLHG